MRALPDSLNSMPSLGAVSQPPLGETPESLQRWLRNTPLLNLEHPKLRMTAQKLGARHQTERHRALAIYQYLRDMPFGAAADNLHTTAPQVLKNARGDCHCKSTLFVALLRVLEIPARLHFVTLKPSFLHGVLDGADAPIEHAYVEVWLGERWLGTDSHVVDLGFAAAAKMRLRAQGLTMGYGMHVNGATNWDGKTDAFAQFSFTDPDSEPIADWGVFDDPYQFYSQVQEMRGRLEFGSRLKWAVGASLVNRRVAALRRNARLK